MLAHRVCRVVLAVAVVGCAQRPEDLSGQEGAGQVDQSLAITVRSPQVSPAAHYDTSPPLLLVTPAERLPYAEHEPKPVPIGPAGTFASLPEVKVQGAIAPLAAPAPLLAFDGVGNGFTGPAGTFTVQYAPPDTNGDVGPNHYVQTVNTDFAVFDKTGKVLYGPVPINTLWSGFGGGCQTNDDGDPTVVYDPMADRWVISQFSVSTTPYMQCVAVSQTPDPTGAWNRYSFSYGNSNFTDYPKIGVWPDAYYTTFNIFALGSIFSGAMACAYDRVKMLAGQAATQQCFNTNSSWGGLLPADMDGARQPPAGSPEYLVSFGSNDLGVWKFHVDWTTPSNSSFTGPTLLAVSSFSAACGGGTCIPQSGTTQQLDSLADRLMYRLAYRNFGDHEAMVVSHAISAGSSAGVRWYELRPNAGHDVSVFQQGTYAPDSGWRWMGSMAQDQQGNIALGFSLSSSGLHPEIHFTGRLAGDPAGQMTQGEGTIINGAGSQIGGSTHTPTLTRWGDYSMMAIDPADDCTFWYTTEYIPANGAFNWGTRVGSFQLPGCGSSAANDFSIGASPGSLSLAAGGSGTSTISTAVAAGSAASVSLSASGVPAGATATLSPTSVNAGGSATLTVDAGTAAAGSYTLTITGTEGSATHSTSVSLTISATPPPNDFSISASPASLNVQQGGSATSTISTAVVSGSAEALALSASGLPAGATAALTPSGITAGQGATLSVNTGTAPAGSYTVTVSAAGKSATHSARVALAIAGPTTAITGPADGATVSGSVTITANASAAVKIELYVDGTLLATGATSPFSAVWDSTQVSDGAHTIGSKAYDAAGDIASAQVSVTTANSSTVQCPPGTTNVGGTCVPNGTGCSTTGSGLFGFGALLAAGLALALRRQRRG